MFIDELVVATKNKGKLKEYKSLLTPSIKKISSISDFDNIPEIYETGSTFKENALIKARIVCDITGKITISDDSGLQVLSLNNEPGIYSARYAGEKSTDEENINKLICNLKNKDNRVASFVCVIALVYPEGEEKIFYGECKGEILDKAQGKDGFGYDPVFYFPPLGKSFADLDLKEKNKYSHRAKAVQKLNKFIEHTKNS